MVSEEKRLQPSTMHSEAMKFKKYILLYFSKHDLLRLLA
ncbi:hypothetical protein K0H71_15320 [Bacillus sp. IITD106]|nr:hypothetical protein [Bacillus sp. IITD106]